MAWANDATSFMADPFGLGNSFLGGLTKSLGLDNTEDIERAKGTLDDILSRVDETGASNRRYYGDFMDRMGSLYGEGAQAYSDAVRNLADAIGSRQDFSYDRSVDEFLDPAREQRARQAMNAIEASASAAGNRFSSNYLDKLAAKQQSLASEEWKAAYDRLMSDRAQQMREWESGQQKINNLGTLAGLYGSDRNKLGDAIGDYYSAMANQNNANLESYSDVAQAKANLDTQRNTGLGGLMSGVGSIIGAIF